MQTNVLKHILNSIQYFSIITNSSVAGEGMIIIFLCFYNLLEFSTLIKYVSFTIEKLKDILKMLQKKLLKR